MWNIYISNGLRWATPAFNVYICNQSQIQIEDEDHAIYISSVE